MNRHNSNRIHGRRQARDTNITLVQHNSLGSCDVFLSLFNSFVEFFPVDIVLLHEPPVYHGSLPSFAGFKAFSPPSFQTQSRMPRRTGLLLKILPVTDIQPPADDVMFLDIFTPEGYFHLSSPKFRVGKVYSPVHTQPSTHTVSPAMCLTNQDSHDLVAGDFNIHNIASDPLCVTSSTEECTSAPYFDQATDLGYPMLNTPGVFTRYPLSGEQRPSVIDLAFANPHIFPAVKCWDATPLPSTGSDHVPIVITLASPSQTLTSPGPKWDQTDWLSLEAPLHSFVVPPPPIYPSPPQLNHWFSSSLNVLTVLVRSVTPTSKPSLHPKPWWTPLLTALRKE